MLADVEEYVRKILGLDTMGIQFLHTMFGYRNKNWKLFKMFDETEVLISGHLEYDVIPNGDIFQYAQGDRTVSPSAKITKDYLYFDHIIRQEPIDETKIDQNYSMDLKEVKD